MGAVIAMAALVVSPADAQAPSPTTLTLDASSTPGPVNPALVGVGWHPGPVPLSTVTELQPRLVRITARLERLSTGPGQVNLAPLLDQAAQIRKLGAEPLVILSYMPPWLGSPNAHGRDPTRVPPADLDAWEKLVHDVVRALATAPAPARRFEAWNEPDIPLFWQDTPQAWAEMIVRSARAVARVEAETKLDLAFGGPATAVPDPIYLATFVQALRDANLPLDFVSWHYYGNTPFFGPDGNEFEEAAAAHPVIGQRNPLASPSSYGGQTTLMRTWTEAALAGSGRPTPPLLLDEWNLSPAGFDLRHDTHEGAAFAAGVLVEMQQAGLDGSAFFQAADETGPAGSPPRTYGGHGLVTAAGVRKPAWWVFQLWQQQGSERVPVAGADSATGLWAAGSRAADRVTLLVTSFSAAQPTARTIDLALTGLPWPPARATVRRLDATHTDAGRAESLSVDGGRVRFDLPAQAVAFVEVRPAAAAAAAAAAPPPGPRPQPVRQLPATGAEGSASLALIVLALGAIAAVLAARSRAPARKPAARTSDGDR